ncbi:MAG TPA: DinB family protein [Methylomirabilota bacterium]|jgi:uncharacterized damage-inducible protein DinB|nr:DinB family protein [Methylomirabilota bacterium]
MTGSTGIPDSILVRLAAQPDALAAIVGGVPPEVLDARPPSGEWSARENLAHLARHAEVFLRRLERILAEDRPPLGRYRAEEDPEWTAWSRLPLPDVLRRLAENRARLIAWARSLSSAQAERTGLHPTFGEMTVPRWLEFFLLHEAHHLYVVMLRVGEVRRR